MLHVLLCSAVDRRPSKAAFYTDGETVGEHTVNKTDSTANFIVFPPFNLGFLLTSVFFFFVYI